MHIMTPIFLKLHTNGLKATIAHYNNISRDFVLRFFYKLATCIPLKNTIVFECESDMDDNPRAIYEYMIKEKRFNKYRFVWIVKDVDFCKKNYFHKKTIFVNRFDEKLKNKLKLNLQVF